MKGRRKIIGARGDGGPRRSLPTETLKQGIYMFTETEVARKHRAYSGVKFVFYVYVVAVTLAFLWDPIYRVEVFLILFVCS